MPSTGSRSISATRRCSGTHRTWLLGRSVYQAVAFEPLEELMYSNENGYLDAFILTARGDEFREERQAWLREDPGAMERYRQWFMDTFEKEPPGMRG